MKKLIRTLTLTIGVCLALLCSVQAIELKTGIGIVETNGLRLRAKPSTEADILDNASYGDNVVIIRESGDFYLVDYNLQIGYMAKGYVTFKERENVELGYGKVADASVNMRAKPDPASDLAATLNAGDKAYIIGFNCGWYKVQYNGLTGYIRSDLLELTEKPKTNTGGADSAGQQLVDLAKQYLGTPYVYGGSSYSGTDCSGFTMYIYKQFGYNLPHSATSQWLSGMGTKIYSISELQPGDLVFFNDPSRNKGKACSHAGIYIGNGKHIHASSANSGGVIISDMTSGYYNTYFVGGLRLG